MIKPSYDLSTLKTNDEIILFVRDRILEGMNLRKRLYPSFAKQANKCETRDELIVLVHKITKNAAKLARELAKETQKETTDIEVTCPHCEIITEMSSDATKLMCPKCLKDILNPNLTEKQNGVTEKVISPKRLHETEATLPKPATEPFSKVEKIKSTKNTRERELLNTSTNTRREIIRPEICTSLSLSVWPMIQEKLNNPDTVKDPSFFNRLRNYSKRALFIIHVLDTFQVLTSYEAWRKAQEITGISIRSRSTVGDLLKDLYTDGFLELEIIERKTNPVPAKVYSIIEYRENYPEKYARATARHRDNIKRLKNHTSNNSDEQKNERIKDIEVSARESSLAQKRGFAEARDLEQKELEATKEQEIKERKGNRYQSTPRTNLIPGAMTQDQVMAESYSKMTASQVKIYSEKNPVFKREYKRLKKEGLL